MVLVHAGRRLISIHPKVTRYGVDKVGVLQDIGYSEQLSLVVPHSIYVHEIAEDCITGIIQIIYLGMEGEWMVSVHIENFTLCCYAYYNTFWY